MKSTFVKFCLLGGVALATATVDAKVIFTPVTTSEGTGVSATQTTQTTDGDGKVITVTRKEITVTNNDGTVEEIIEITTAESVPDGGASSGFITTVTVQTTTYETPPEGERTETGDDTNVGPPQDVPPPVVPEVPTLETEDDVPVISEP